MRPVKTDANPRKLAVLGGGIASLAAVYELTNEPDWQSRFDITVYQMGWRLGGKGASSRNPALNERIEEHGLHILMGFYENVHRLMRRCYAELDRDVESPLATWEDAFKPHNFIVHQERFAGRWINWPVEQPAYDGEPGDGQPIASLVTYIQRLLDYIVVQFECNPISRMFEENTAFPNALAPLHARLRARLTELHLWPHQNQDPTPWESIRVAYHLAQLLDEDPLNHFAIDHQLITTLVERFTHWLDTELDGLRDSHAKAHQAWVSVDYAATILCGLFRDGVLYSGFDHLDTEEFREWLARHGASESTLKSALTDAIYVLAFAYENGQPDQPNIGAGTGLRTVLRLTFGYKKAVFWMMQAGMGETVFAPLYLVLKRRGVRFEFFQRVKQLRLDETAKQVKEIEIGVQATVQNSPYHPLRDVEGLPCWPLVPNYQQLVEGEALEADGVNLESFWTPWRDVSERTLCLGKDFDEILLGIPVSAHEHLCGDLIKANPRWQAMCAHLRSIQTQGVQIWLSRDQEDLQWMMPDAVASNGDGPLNVWADMTHLLPIENWQASKEKPRRLIYFCGAMETGETTPGPQAHAFPAEETAKVQARAAMWLKDNGTRTWPGASTAGPEMAFDWNTLADEECRDGHARLDAHYFRANVDPTERYILSVQGSLPYRLRSDESGFSNLCFAGDWVRTGLNIGCLEAAVISGMQAARTIGGAPQDIVGETDI